MTPQELCAALRAFRIRARLRQDAVARSLGVAQSQVSRWESGKDVPRPHNIEAIARLVWGTTGGPRQSLVHFVTHSDQTLLLFDDQHRLLAASQSVSAPDGTFARFGWAIDPDRNPAFQPAFNRYREVLADPRATIGLRLTVPFVSEGQAHVALVRKSIYASGAGRFCLAEIAFRDALAGERQTVLLEEIRMEADLPARATRTIWPVVGASAQ